MYRMGTKVWLKQIGSRGLDLVLDLSAADISLLGLDIRRRMALEQPAT